MLVNKKSLLTTNAVILGFFKQLLAALVDEQDAIVVLSVLDNHDSICKHS